jgi:hypothetical protein
LKFSDFSANERAIPWWILLASCIVYVANLDFASTGDTIYYANIIDTLRFDQLTAHQAYYLLGFMAAKLFGWTFGLSTDQGLALMSALFGAGALSVGYLLLKHYLDSGRDALIGTLMLFLCHRFFVNATSAEIYIVQTFFIWSSFLLFENRRFYTAGLSIALAIWVSPLTVAFGFWFPVVAYLRGFGIRALVRLSIPVALIYLPFLYFFYEELLWGVRGLINEDQRRQLDLIEGGRNFFTYQFKHYSFLNLLIIPALFVLRREKVLLWISLAVVLPNIYVISQLSSEDNVFILPLDIFFVCWFVIGWRVLRERSLVWVAAAVLVAHGIVFLIAERPFLRAAHKNYDDEMRAIGRIVQDAGNAILVADWHRRMAFVYFNRQIASYPLEQDYWYDMSFDISYLTMHRFNKTKSETDDFANYGAVFVLDSWKYSPQASLFLDDTTLQQRYERQSQRREVEHFLDVECQPILSGLYTLYRCR